MNKVLAEVRIENIYNSFIHISQSPQTYDYIGQREYDKEFNLLLKQGFIWYRDFIAFSMTSDLERYWIKIAVSDTLKIDPVITEAIDSDRYLDATVIILPFEVRDKRIYVFGDYDEDLTLSFTLPPRNYQLLFQNRHFTREEIEASPNNDCRDLDYDDWYDDMELCLLTFIPTEEAIEPKMIAVNNSQKSKFRKALILFDREMYQSSD